MHTLYCCGWPVVLLLQDNLDLSIHFPQNIFNCCKSKVELLRHRFVMIYTMKLVWDKLITTWNTLNYLEWNSFFIVDLYTSFCLSTCDMCVIIHFDFDIYQEYIFRLITGGWPGFVTSCWKSFVDANCGTENFEWKIYVPSGDWTHVPLTEWYTYTILKVYV